MEKRKDWNSYFMDIAELVATRSTCLRRQVGAVIVKDKKILTTGYNGSPANTAHCLDIGCMREQLKVPSGQRHELCRAIHAEQNAIIQAACSGTAIEGATIYTTTQPCVICAKMIINAGIVKIIYKGAYDDSLGLELIREAKVRLIQYK